MNKIKIIGTFLGVLAAVSLASCGVPPEQQEASKVAINEQLPDGCEFQFYGWYETAYRPIAVGAIICAGKVTATDLQWTTSNGKSRTNHSSTVSTPQTKVK